MAASGEKGVISNGSLCFCFYVWLGDYEVDEESRNRISRFVLSLSGKSKLLPTRNPRFSDPYAPSSSFSLFIWIRRCFVFLQLVRKWLEIMIGVLEMQSRVARLHEKLKKAEEELPICRAGNRAMIEKLEKEVHRAKESEKTMLESLVCQT
ncbi:hypothetical protein HPP92_015843 [Vanilla planifolia]|uniref:Uncharacterized protein n=1 Tax=Vanilla planifolia TaxID=51239 RepID=A0A835QP51_VANPL|nr:hypothetical protein HPP92_015843 [Vanilla planifolia]